MSYKLESSLQELERGGKAGCDAIGGWQLENAVGGGKAGCDAIGMCESKLQTRHVAMMQEANFTACVIVSFFLC